MSTATGCARPVRSRQSSAAASPAAAIVTCAAVPTRNDDGSTGSVPVSATRSSAAGSPPPSDQSACRASLGVVTPATLELWSTAVNLDLLINAMRLRTLVVAVALWTACKHAPTLPPNETVPGLSGATQVYTLTNLHPDEGRVTLYTGNFQQPGLIPICSKVTLTYADPW